MKQLILLLILVLTPFFGNTIDMNETKIAQYKLPESCDFLQAESNSSQSFDCSPQLTPKFSNSYQGVLINAPKQVLWDKDLDLNDFAVSPFGEREGPLRLMISGLLKVPYGTLNISDDYIYDVIIVAVNQKTSKVYSGRMNRRGEKPQEIDFSLAFDPIFGNESSDNSLKGDVKENFNIDLVQNLKIPIVSADYSVYAVLGDYKSNTREIKVKVE